jgi:undecaprenyl-diphosphatase
MNLILKTKLKDILPALALLLVLALAVTQDKRVLLWSRTLDDATVNFFQAITQIGHATWMLGATLLVTLVFYVLARTHHGQEHRNRFQRLTHSSTFVFVSLAGAGIIATLLKYLVGRARPSQFLDYGAYYVSPATTDSEFASFPSGHATNLFALAFSLAVLFPRARIPLLLFASGIAFSRVMIGEHFLSDFVGAALLAYLFVAWWKKRSGTPNENLVKTT